MRWQPARSPPARSSSWPRWSGTAGLTRSPLVSDEPLQAAPGTLNLWVFEQDEVWLDVVGTPHLLHEMTITYRANGIAHLLKHVEYFYQAKVEQRQIADLLAAHQDGQDEQPLLPEDPTEWLEATPLMRRLRSMTPEWEDRVTEDLDELTDHDTGSWVVHTENSRYLIDLDSRTCTRLPNLPGRIQELRRDGEELPLRRIDQCRFGEPGALLLDVRGDGISTLRVTSIVRRITRAHASEEL